jgi:nitrous oxide reductase accessory protein NosL
MDSRLSGRRLAAISGLTAIIAMGAITAGCAKEEKAPETTTPTTTTTTTTTTPAPGAGAPPAPGEKSINPT